ncbi:MAG TPA: phosphatase PAP2 family protein [Gemmatimonadaceae bacterium]|nr:phosphatase PAP2 family protein [Gemmatimonadaceae bacterium]
MHRIGLVFVLVVLYSNTVAAQKDSSTTASDHHHVRAWIVPTVVIASTAIDPEMREWALQTHSRSLDHLARIVNPLGTAHVLVPAMAGFYVASAITHQTSAEHSVVETAAAYAASDVVESILKPVIGRERPHAGGNSHRFRPFTSNGDWHSLPSAHMAHITAIASAISMETDSRVISGACDALVALVGWDRVYEDQHWTSDVTATAALTALVSSATVRWVRSRWTSR